MEIIVEVCERMGDWGLNGVPKYHAQVKLQPGIWACGYSRQEAIDDLVKFHQDVFAGKTISIENYGRMAR